MTLSMLPLSVLAVASVVLATPASAQAPSNIDSSCTYSTCALRVEPAYWGPRLVRGPSGEPVGRAGFFGGGAEILSQGGDSARLYHQEYRQSARRASVLALLGSGLYVVGLFRTGGLRANPLDDVGIGTTVAGAVALGFSISAQRRAGRGLSRAVWWYNHSLAERTR